MIVTKKHLPRRTVLRGLGATLALPLLDSMIPAFAPRRVAAAAPINRFGAIYVGMGMNMPVWTQPAEGALEMNEILRPMEPFRDLALVLEGLDSQEAISVDAGQHPRAQSSWLTGCRAFKTNGPDIRLGVSLDQILAREFEKETQLGSLELTLDPTDLAGNCAYGFSCAYNNTIAWRTPTTPLPMENNPRNVFERLFGASDTTDPTVRQRELEFNGSVLDSVLEEVGGLRQSLGTVDRRKVTEYLDAVRDIERRIQMAAGQADTALTVVDKPVGIPETFEQHAQLMFDLQLLAFQTDLTRVFTYVMARESSVRSYPEIGVPDSHHPLSHHQNNPEKLAKQAKLNSFHLQQLAAFLEKLRATTEGDHTLLDTTMVLYGSGMSDSNLHIPLDVPTLLIAGSQFDITGDRCLKHAESGTDAATPLANLQLTIAEKMGVAIEQFGDSEGRLTRLTGI